MIAASANIDPVGCHEGTMQIIGLTSDMFADAVAARVFDKI